MKTLSYISTALIVGTTLSLLIRSWLAPTEIEIDLSDEDYQLYL